MTLSAVATQWVTVIALSLPLAQPLQNADIIQKAQLAIERLEEADYAAVMTMFSANLREKFPESKLQQTWETLHRQAGALKSTHPPAIKTNKSLRHVVVPADFENSKLQIEVVFNAAGEIAGLLLNRRK